MHSNQVLSKDLVEPFCIGLFDNSGIGAEVRTREANEFCGQLDQAGIKFACVNGEPPIYVYTERQDLKKVKRLGLKSPTPFDRR